MGKSDIRLTIAIPTYNRCNLLRQTIESVVTQRGDGIEIIVSDNASTDGTKAMMEKFCQGGNICYFRNSENLGMDRNFLNCLQKANGEYIHLLSDDDLLLPGAVQKILSLIEQEKPDYIHLNRYRYSGDIYDPNDRRPPEIKLNEDLVTTNKNIYMEYLGVYITFISASVVKKSNIIKIENPEKYFDTHFLHAHLILDTLKGEKSKVIITKEAYVVAKNNNSGGFDLYEVFIKQYKNLLLNTAVRNGFDHKLMERIYVNDVNGFIRDSILKYSITDNAYMLKHKKFLFQYTYMYTQIWGKTYLYAILPCFILKRIYMHKRRREFLQRKERYMELIQMQKRLIFETEGGVKSEVVAELCMRLPSMQNPDEQKTVGNLIRELDAMPEKDCWELIHDIRGDYRSSVRPNSIRSLPRENEQKWDKEKWRGHNIMALKRFDPDVQHMIVFDVLSGNPRIGRKVGKMRLFLTETEYQRELANQDKGYINIQNHAKVSDGHLHYAEGNSN